MLLLLTPLGGCAGELPFEPGPAAPAFGETTPVDEPSCGEERIDVGVEKLPPPELYLVVDRSSSMNLRVDTADPASTTRWAAMRATLSQIVDQHESAIEFGLTLYPGAESCTPGSLSVTPQVGNAALIKAALDQTTPSGLTPTHATLGALHAYLSTLPPVDLKRYVLLATDGLPTCKTDTGTTAQARTLEMVEQLASAGVATFVVGFGEITRTAPENLEALALAGGVAQTGAEHGFYSATGTTELATAMGEIAGRVTPPPCSYQLQSAPPVPERVVVTFNGETVPRTLSNQDGWNYGDDSNRTIVFHGATCEQLRGADAASLKVTFGCKGPVIK